ncbi:MAG: enoyl-CoA hydratase/isomerase family protein [Desulfatitalea sp.]|nr:enoyl-CoA hydratase/isomerase family protein [Desulfatitalea sp.]NNK01636.1 enoyl-CoA hydratase/isomerase family protein [Desulfatitalea sp.]
MAELKYLTFENTDGVAKITLNRPKHNVLDINMMKELNGKLEELTGDAALKCLVLQAEGPSWCAGVEVGDHKPDMVDEMIGTFNRIFELMDRLEVPTIAAVHGACLGGGMEVAIACDIIIASEKAVFGQPEIKLGFFPPYAAIRLPQLVGPSKSIEICTTGKRYTARQALTMGLVSHVADENDFSGAVQEMIKEIGHCSPLIIRLNKRAVKSHLGMRFTDALAGVSDLFLNTLMRTEDTLEGIQSFEEKRRAVWKNK